MHRTKKERERTKKILQNSYIDIQITAVASISSALQFFYTNFVLHICLLVSFFSVNEKQTRRDYHLESIKRKNKTESPLDFFFSPLCVCVL